jgi:hypothetical protein
MKNEIHHLKMLLKEEREINIEKDLRIEQLQEIVKLKNL